MRISTPDFFRSKWFFLLSIIVLSYTFFVLGKMVYQNYEVNQQIENLEKEVAEVENENQKLSDLIAFFQTETFKEKEAREKLGVVKPGEKVLVFPEEENNEVSILETATGKDNEEDEEIPNYKKWWNFFFKEK